MSLFSVSQSVSQSVCLSFLHSFLLCASGLKQWRCGLTQLLARLGPPHAGEVEALASLLVQSLKESPSLGTCREEGGRVGSTVMQSVFSLILLPWSLLQGADFLVVGRRG